MVGLWNSGTGEITYYEKNEDPQQPICSYEKHGKSVNKKSRIFFLPQRPYMILGTLRQQLLYPTWADDAILISNSTKSKSMCCQFHFPQTPNFVILMLTPTKFCLIFVVLCLYFIWPIVNCIFVETL